MSEEKVLANAEYGENHENDDMIAQNAVKSNETISFSVSDEARPQHTWTKKAEKNGMDSGCCCCCAVHCCQFFAEPCGD